jgi:hypothetical protein
MNAPKFNAEEHQSMYKWRGTPKSFREAQNIIDCINEAKENIQENILSLSTSKIIEVQRLSDGYCAYREKFELMRFMLVQDENRMAIYKISDCFNIPTILFSVPNLKFDDFYTFRRW